MNTYTTAQLVGVIQSLIRPVNGLLNRYFRKVTTFTTEEVHVDVIPGSRAVAPFVSPLVEGQIMTALGQSTRIIKPAYVKQKIPFNAPTFMTRAPGEQIGGSLSPQARLDLHLANNLEHLVNAINRRMEVMASEALRTGALVISGEKYPTQNVSFGRDNDHTVTPAAGEDWTTLSDPFITFRAYNALALQATGIGLNDAIMGPEAWALFLTKTPVKERLLQINARGTNADLSAIAQEGLQYMGTFDNVNVFVYAGWYTHPTTGVLTEIFPTKGLLMAASPDQGSGIGGVEGSQYFGAIQDPKAGLQAMEYFPKMWDEEDPAVRWLMVQSAPIVAPGRPDCTVYAADIVGS